MASTKKKTLKARVAMAIDRLATEYPEAECALHYKTPEQLLVATILSAQCTDVQVNKVTKVLFKKFPSPKELSKAKLSIIEKIIHSTGFYKNKAKNIIACAKKLTGHYGGKVPKKMEELLELPGVGRKTANVILGNAFSTPGLVVDTHVKRISQLIGFTQETDPEKIELDLMEIVPKKNWTMFSHWIIYHGRNICIARRPKCGECVLQSICNYGRKNI